MTIVKVNKDWRIEVDIANFTLFHRSVVQDKESKNYGQEQWLREGYFSTPGGAFLHIVKTEAVKPGEVFAMQEMTQVYCDLAAQFGQPAIKEQCDRALAEIKATVARGGAVAVTNVEPEPQAAPEPLKAPQKPKDKPAPPPKPEPTTKKVRKPSRG